MMGLVGVTDEDEDSNPLSDTPPIPSLFPPSSKLMLVVGHCSLYRIGKNSFTLIGVGGKKAIDVDEDARNGNFIGIKFASLSDLLPMCPPSPVNSVYAKTARQTNQSNNNDRPKQTNRLTSDVGSDFQPKETLNSMRGTQEITALNADRSGACDKLSKNKTMRGTQDTQRTLDFEDEPWDGI